MIKTLTENVKCTECAKSKMNGFELICTEFYEVIERNERWCTAFEKLNEVNNDR